MEKTFIKLRENLWVNCNDIIEVRSSNPQQATITYRDFDSGQEANAYTVAHLEGEYAASFMEWLDSITIDSRSKNINREKSQALTVCAAKIANKILADYIFHGKVSCLRKDITQSLTAVMTAAQNRE